LKSSGYWTRGDRSSMEDVKVTVASERVMGVPITMTDLSYTVKVCGRVAMHTYATVG